MNVQASFAFIVLPAVASSLQFERASHGDKETDGQTQCNIGNGKWQRAETPPLYDRLHVDPEFRCLLKHAEQYSWVPDDCELPAFQADKLVNITTRRPILMVGDSLVRNMYEGLRMSVPDVHNINLIRLDYFGSHTKKSGTSLGVYLDSMDLTFLEKATNNTIVLLGGGHHFAHRGNKYYWRGETLNDTGGGINVEAYRLALTQVLRNLEAMKFSGPVVLKTYSPAHFFQGDWDSNGGCDGFAEPVNDITEYTNLTATSFSDIEQVNSMLHSMTSLPLNIKILDVTGMSLGRADAHPGHETTNDCSHWCLPGLPDAWNQAFLHMMMNM